MRIRQFKRTARAVLLMCLGTVGTMVAQAKRAPTLCFAMMSPTVQGVSGSAVDASNGVRDLMASYLSGPTYKVVPLEAKLLSQAREEAKEKKCEPLVIINVTRKTGGHSFMKALGQGAAASSWRLPGGGSVASAGAAAGLQAASAMAAATKAKDEIRFEYRLESASGQVQFGPKTETQTAKTDGEDLLSPVVARAAEAIVSSVIGDRVF